MTPLNPDYPYLMLELDAEKRRAEIWLRVARERGRLDHPAAIIAKQNLELIETLRNARPS